MQQGELALHVMQHTIKGCVYAGDAWTVPSAPRPRGSEGFRHTFLCLMLVVWLRLALSLVQPDPHLAQSQIRVLHPTSPLGAPTAKFLQGWTWSTQRSEPLCSAVLLVCRWGQDDHQV